MNLKTIEKLEFNKICEILKNYAVTYLGKDYANNLKPMFSKKRNRKSSRASF